MKKISYIIFLFLLLFVGCVDNKEEINLIIDGKEEIYVSEEVSLAIRTNYLENLEYISSNEEVLKINNGIIKGISAGEAKVKVIAGDVEKEITIKVVEKEKEYTLSIQKEIKESKVELTIDTDLPNNYQNYTWSCDNDNVTMEVSTDKKKCLITFVKDGFSTVTVKADKLTSDVVLYSKTNEVIKEKEIEIVYSNKEIKDLIVNTINSYKKALECSLEVKIKNNNDERKIIFESKYNLDHSINELKYCNGINYYVKDHKLYIEDKDSKTYYELTAINERDIIERINATSVFLTLGDVILEEELFDALVLVSKENNVYTFRLDEDLYKGSIIKKEIVKDVKIIISIDGCILTDYNIYFDATNSKVIEIDFLGLACNVQFPKFDEYILAKK